MTLNKKKRSLFVKAQNFFEKYPVILLGQHNNCTPKEWALFKKNDIPLLVLKNSSGTLAFQKTIEKKKNLEQCLTSLFGKDMTNVSESLFQGPCFVLGCQDTDQLSKAWNLLKSNSKLLFIGALGQNQTVYNHLDIEKMVTLNNEIYSEFLLQLENPLSSFLEQSRHLHVLNEIPHSIFAILSAVKK